MAYDYSFKKFQHQTRMNSPEENFALGMNFTDTPLDPGASKILVNFDVADDGTSLKPRAGIRVSKVAIKAKAYSAIDTSDFCASNISFASEFKVSSDESFKYIILCNPTSKKTYLSILDSTIEHTNFGIESEGYTVLSSVLTSKVNTYPNSEIHGMPITSNTLLTKQIGTKAWNNSYFFFGKATEDAVDYLYNVKYDTNEETFIFNKVVPTVLTALEASPNKYNMLSTTPYTFTNSFVAGAFVLQGVLPYLGANLIVSPKLNTKYKYKLAYTVPSNSKYDIKWEWKDFSSSEWTTLKTETIAFTTGTPPDIYCEFSAPVFSSLIRITVTGYTADTLNTLPDQVVPVSINCEAEKQNSSANSDLKTYDLSKATGMCYWQNRLVLWGFHEDSVIIVSETNLPEWFPYPNNIDSFEEPIIHCEPYLDYLLVFTTSKLYKLTMLPDGSGWSKTCLQDNLHLTPFDTNLIKTIKNMVFFKSGNSYYMVVPSSTTGSLVMAPIAKPIQWLLDNFEDSIIDMIKNIYNYSDSLELINCFNYIDYNDIIIKYVFKTTKCADDSNAEATRILLNFCLIYDTDARVWRIHIFESTNIYKMFKQDATNNGTLLCATKVSQEFVNGASTTTANSLIFQFFEKDDNNPKDFFVPVLYPITLTSQQDVKEYFKTFYKFKNYQYLDTGYRTFGYPDTKKRHREFQLRLNNKDYSALNFGFSFLIDGDFRKSMYEYNIEYNTDVLSDKYQTIDVIPKLNETVFVEPTTILGELEDGVNTWTLDSSMFPTSPLLKTRIRLISGKGYNSKVILLSTNESNYELLGICWVYKLMNLR